MTSELTKTSDESDMVETQPPADTEAGAVNDTPDVSIQDTETLVEDVTENAAQMMPEEEGDSIPADMPETDWQSMTLFPTDVNAGSALESHAVAGDYLPILIFLGLASVMAVVMVLLPMLIGRQKPDKEKLSAYECGFDSYGDARGKFDVRFYLVAILFIIFDLEVAFLFPWAVSLGTIGVFGFWSMMIFLGVLTVGFIYEWKKGALDWE